MVPIRTVAAAILVGIVLAFLAGYAVAQRQPPTQNVGQTEELLRSLDLSNELESTKGRTLRMRKVTLAPQRTEGRGYGFHPRRVCPVDSTAT